MENLKAKHLSESMGLPSEVTEANLEAGERLIRVSVMTAFIAVLGLEAWLLCQVFRLF